MKFFRLKNHNPHRPQILELKFFPSPLQGSFQFDGGELHILRRLHDYEPISKEEANQI